MENRRKKIEEMIQEFENRCRASGIKITPQRLAIYRELISRKDHPAVEDIYRSLRRKMPGISLPTVYRTLGFFEEKGLIMKVPTVGDKVRYDGNPHPHSHFICTSCGRIMDLEETVEVEKQKLLDKGFLPEKCITVCFGKCPSCLEKERSKGSH